MIPQSRSMAGNYKGYINQTFIAFKGEPFVNNTAITPNIYYLCYSGWTSVSSICNFTSLKFDKKSITWYGDTDDYQLNKAADIYYYIAIG